jgi:hypothetical protein
MKKNSSNHLKVKEFVEFVKKELNKKSGKLILRTKIANGETQDGEFCEKTNTIRCKKNLSSYYWVGVLAHEYCHFVQSSKKTEFWVNFQKNLKEPQNVGEIISDDDGNKNKKYKFNKKKRQTIISTLIDMELECEKMTLELVKDFDLPLDIKDYITLANIIFYKYLYWAEYEIWPSFSEKKKNNKINCDNLDISKLMSREKYKSIRNIPKKILNIFKNNI